jgi:hypothetical protein
MCSNGGRAPITFCGGARRNRSACAPGRWRCLAFLALRQRGLARRQKNSDRAQSWPNRTSPVRQLDTLGFGPQGAAGQNPLSTWI